MKKTKSEWTTIMALLEGRCDALKDAHDFQYLQVCDLLDAIDKQLPLSGPSDEVVDIDLTAVALGQFIP